MYQLQHVRIDNEHYSGQRTYQMHAYEKEVAFEVTESLQKVSAAMLWAKVLIACLI